MTSLQSAQIEYAAGGMRGSRIAAGIMRLLDWNLTPEGLVGWIEAALDMGVTTFDHADIYGGYRVEEEFGKALALKPSLRERMQIVTKCGIHLVNPRRPQNRKHYYETTRAHIVWSAENSLRMLNTDTLDLLLIHRPDPLMDADEVAAAFDQLKGKVRHFGVSNFTPSQFDLLQSRLDFPLTTNQIEFSPLNVAPALDGTLDQMQRLRRLPQSWSPVGGRSFFKLETEQSRRVMDVLTRIGANHGGAGVDQVALAFVLAHPARPVAVIGTGKLDRVQAAVEAESLTLDRQEWFEIWEASLGHEVP